MILDALLQFSSAQTLVLAAGNYDSTNTIDIGINGIPSSANGGGARDLGIGDDPAMKFHVTLAAAFAGGSIQVVLQGAPDNGAGAPGAFTDFALGPVLAGPLSASARLLNIDMPRIPTGSPVPRFLKLQYRLTGGAGTAGAANAYMVLDQPNRLQGVTGLDSGYPAGIAINN